MYSNELNHSYSHLLCQANRVVLFIRLEKKKPHGSNLCDFLTGKLGDYGPNETSVWKMQNWVGEETPRREELKIESQNAKKPRILMKKLALIL